MIKPLFIRKPHKNNFFFFLYYSAEVFFMFSIDDHKLEIIEVDGTYVKPFIVEKLPINIAQRYSVIVKADREIKNYWIRATIQEACVANNTFTINSNSAIDYKVLGILKYKGAGNNSPTTKESSERPESCKDLPTKSLIPLDVKPISEPYKTFVMNVTFTRDPRNITLGFINGYSYSPDLNYPTLEKILDGVNPYSLSADQVPFVYDTNNHVIEIILLNPLNSSHPFHMHGHAFYVLGIGSGSQVVKGELNTKNPIYRDTVTAPAASWVVIRFKADNPGVWSFHCHIEVSKEKILNAWIKS
jgi:FtsP/CotA-like multicopper oxidase with cupredoxin domain